MEMLHMNINVDQLLKELESVTITALDDNALCCLGLIADGADCDVTTGKPDGNPAADD